MIQEIRRIIVLIIQLRNTFILSFNKEYSLVSQVTWPVCVNLKLTADVLGDDEDLLDALLNKIDQSVSLLVRYEKFVPFILFQAQTFQSVVSDECYSREKYEDNSLH